MISVIHKNTNHFKFVPGLYFHHAQIICKTSIILFSRKRPRKATLKKGEPCEYDLCSTLDDLYNGKKKKMKIARRRLQPDGTYKKEETVLTIDIKKGWKEGTKITFHNESNESPGFSTGDIIFKIKVKS